MVHKYDLLTTGTSGEVSYIHWLDVTGSMIVSKTIRGSSNLSAFAKKGGNTMFTATRFYMVNALSMMLQLLPPLALPAYASHVGNQELTIVGHLLSWYTSGYE